MKEYYLQYNIGKAKYVVCFHDGVKTHDDGSKFFDIKICKNKKQLKGVCDVLVEQGYKET